MALEDIGTDVERDPTRRRTPGELVARTLRRPVDFAPGTEWEYCNTCDILLGLIAERATGRPFAALLRERIITPLALVASAGDYSRPPHWRPCARP